MNKTFDIIRKIFAYACDDSDAGKRSVKPVVAAPSVENDGVSADYYKDLLRKIYPCKVPFDLVLVHTKPKTRMGSYNPRTRMIRINDGWGDTMHSTETAIHEYAHHIHFTEKGKTKRKEEPHGRQFWQIYGQLMFIAKKKGFYDHFDAL